LNKFQITEIMTQRIWTR